MRTLLLLTVFATVSGCHKNLKHVRATYAAELKCPDEKVIVLELPDGNPKQGEAWNTYGCDQRRLCFDDSSHGEWVCRWPDDLQTAAGRLKLETNCPTEQMQPTAYQELGRAPTEDDDGSKWNWTGGAWRIAACGKAYVCNVNAVGASCVAAADLTGRPAGAPPPPAGIPPAPAPSAK